MSTCNLQVAGSQKLKLHFVGLFSVLEHIGPVTYQLEILKQWKVDDIFQALLLKPYTSGGEDGISAPDPVVIDG